MTKKQLLETSFKNAKAQWRSKGATIPQINLITDGIGCPGGTDTKLAFTSLIDGKIEIYLSTDWKKFSNGLLLQVLLHEIGHAVKCRWDHSDNPNDVMYISVDGKHQQLTTNDMKWAK